MYAAASVKAVIAERVGRATGVPMADVLGALVRPRVLGHGDWAVPVPKLPLPTRPDDMTAYTAQLARAVATGDELESVDAQAVFLNVRVDRQRFMRSVLRDVEAHQARYGHRLATPGTPAPTLAIAVSTPSIGAPIGLAALRSMLHAQALANLGEAMGARVVRLAHLCDWDTTYGFAAAGFARFGSEDRLQRLGVRYLDEVASKARRESQKSIFLSTGARQQLRLVQQGDEPARSLWERLRALVRTEYEHVCGLVGLRFDGWTAASDAAARMPDLIDAFRRQGRLIEVDGALAVDTAERANGPVVVQTSDGGSTPAATLAATVQLLQDRYPSDRLIHVSAGDSELLHAQLAALVRLLPGLEQRAVETVSVGVIREPGNGRAVYVRELLAKTHEAMRQVTEESEDRYSELEADGLLEHVVTHAGLAAVVVQDLQARRGKEYVFDWARMSDSRGDTGPYLQYAHARLLSIEQLAELPLPTAAALDMSVLVEEEAYALLTEIARFPDIVEQAFERREPSTLVQYLLGLGHAVSAATQVLRVKGQPERLAAPRLLLFTSARVTLGNGLRLLGLTPVQRM